MVGSKVCGRLEGKVRIQKVVNERREYRTSQLLFSLLTADKARPETTEMVELKFLYS